MRIAWWGFILLMVLGPIGSSAQTKYDPMFGTAWQRAQKQHASRRWLEAVIRVASPMTDQTLSQLTAAGFRHRSVLVTQTGDAIITGRIQVRHVQELLDLPIVLSIEGGGMGGRKGTQGLK